MRSRRAVRVLTIAVLLGGPGPEARADIPSGSATWERDGDAVSIRFRFSYHDGLYGVPECTGRIVRDGEELFHGGLGEAAYTCECGKNFDWVPEDGDATGQGCGLNEGLCPAGHICHCTRECKPFVDDPCDGTYDYELVSDSPTPTSPCVATARVTVDWVGICVAGQSCATAGAEGLVLVMFLVGAWLPFRRARRRAVPR